MTTKCTLLKIVRRILYSEEDRDDVDHKHTEKITQSERNWSSTQNHQQNHRTHWTLVLSSQCKWSSPNRLKKMT